MSQSGARPTEAEEPFCKRKGEEEMWRGKSGVSSERELRVLPCGLCRRCQSHRQAMQAACSSWKR